MGALVAIELLTVVAKFASSLSAAANSLSVSKADGALSRTLATAVLTYEVVAILLEFSD